MTMSFEELTANASFTQIAFRSRPPIAETSTWCFQNCMFFARRTAKSIANRPAAG